MRICSVEGCERKYSAQGCCVMHYKRYIKSGKITLLPKQTPTCIVDDCVNVSHAKSMCSVHYSRMHTTGKLEVEHERRTGCVVPECDRKHYGKGWCNMHWNRVHQTGSLYLEPVATECKIEGCTYLGALSDGRYKFPLGFCNTHYRRFKKYGDPHERKMIMGEDRKYDPLYQTYSRILRRVDNPNSSEYQYYGQLGIKICCGWRGIYGFSNFKKDMGNRPSEKHSVDRIDVFANYSCGYCEECVKNKWKINCRWATVSVQAANKRKKNKTVGVSWDKYHKRWRATLILDKEVKLDKKFKIYEDAVEARKEAEFKYLGYYINEYT